MTDKIGKDGAELSKDQIATIKARIIKLRRINLMPDVADAFEKLKYDNVELKIKESSREPHC